MCTETEQLTVVHTVELAEPEEGLCSVAAECTLMAT